MKVVLSPKADIQLKNYIENINYEISGLGLVEKREGYLYVPEIFLLTQEVTGAETDLNSEAVAQFVNEKFQDPNFPVENLKLWWHSHVNMGVFWSGTDNSTIERLDTEEAEENWWLSIVGNKQGQRLARVDIYQPHRMWQNNLSIEVQDPVLLAAIQAEIAEKVTVKTLPQFQPGKKNLITPTNVIVDNAAKNVLGGGSYQDDDYDLPGGYGYAPNSLESDYEFDSKANIYKPKKGKKFKKGRNRHWN